MKLLLLFGVLFLVIWLMRGSRSRNGKKDSAGPKAERSPTESAREEMVACRQCGVHLPRGDALSDTSGEWFCSAAHRDENSSAPPN
jgi:uncharacterized protein